MDMQMQMTKSMLATAPVGATIPVKDLERAKKFYIEKLGLELDREVPGLAMFKGGMGSMFALYTTQATSNATVATFLVNDLDAIMDDLRKRGVEFVDYDMPDLKTTNGVAEYPDGSRASWVMDSEGNALSIAQM